MDYIDIFTDSLAYQLHEAHRRVQDHYLRHLEKLGLTPVQVYTLCILKDKKLAIPSEIAELLKISRPSTTNLLRRMERDGLISRMPDKMNRRRVWVVATQKGVALMEKAHRSLMRAEASLNYDGVTNIGALKASLVDLSDGVSAIKSRSERLSVGSKGRAENKADPVAGEAET